MDLGEIHEIYECLIGKKFTAAYMGEKPMATGNYRSALEITEPHMIALLEGITEQVDELGGKVWMAITGPEEYEEYWLWVEELSNEELEEGESYTFRVTDIQVFGENPKYDAGVSITVEIM